MAWFELPLGEAWRMFWAKVNDHEFVARILSYEVTRSEYRRLFEDMRHYDRRLPAILRLAAARCGSGERALCHWLLERADEHAAWMRLWPAAVAREAGDSGPDSPGPTASAAALAELCARLAVLDDPVRLFGVLTALGWFESTVVGALHDVLGTIYGADDALLAPLASRLESTRHDPRRFDLCLGGTADAGVRPGFAAGLRASLPPLAGMLTAAGAAVPEPAAAAALAVGPRPFAAVAAAS